jgi:endonuclease YncB( thermonuclease family)
MAKQFQLWVTVFDWHDGDSFHGVLDQSCYTYHGQSKKPPMYRCALIDAPELKVGGLVNPAGIAALEYAIRVAPPGEYQCISTELDEYGRPLLDLITDRGLFSYMMIGAGHAVAYKR